MGTLDNDINKFKNRPWLVSLICAIFVLYPNWAWFHCDMTFLAADDKQGFLLFFIYRFVFFYSLIWLLVRYNLSKLTTPTFFTRFGWNALFTVAGFVIYEIITHLTYSYDRFLSILIFQFTVMGLLTTFIGYISVLYTLQREKDQEIERLRVENLQSRCDALTNQINPHFFFNSLNGISALIRKRNDTNTLLYVTKLSDIFRYILQSEKRGLVPLVEELDFVESFSHVMEVRFANKFFLKVDVPEEMRSLRIPVLALLPLIENTTVHNAIDSEHPMHILIRLNESCELIISNPIYPKITPPDTNGTGLRNLENRFELLLNRRIRVENDGVEFRVVLPLK